MLAAQNPLVLTLTLDARTQSILNGLRKRYFPAERNHLDAHLTLFHAVPAHRGPELDALLQSVCAETKPWTVFVGEPAKMGNRGVYAVFRSRPSGAIEDLHAYLLRRLKRGVHADADRLTNQDVQTLRRPHVTILNKAKSDEQVETCLREVGKEFAELYQGQITGEATGFQVWEYLGGPWKPLQRYTFGERGVTVGQ
ncbi:hypothetical protein Q5752_002704 [Cryptotrichosporon argae]